MFCREEKFHHSKWNPFITAKRRVKKLQREIPAKPTKDLKIFIVAGFEMPFLSNIHKLPQPVEISYAVTFFEQTPIYNTQQTVCDNDAENFVFDEEQKSNLQNHPPGSIEIRIKRWWKKINEAKDYNNWALWWRDFKWCDRNLNFKLKEMRNTNVKNFFAPNPDKTIEEWIQQTMNEAQRCIWGSEKTNCVRILTSIYMLMNERFLENLQNFEIGKLQGMILNISNDWWIAKMRRFLFTWSEYYKMANSNQWKPNRQRNRNYEAIRARWESPIFHWLAKQVILELKV